MALRSVSKVPVKQFESFSAVYATSFIETLAIARPLHARKGMMCGEFVDPFTHRGLHTKALFPSLVQSRLPPTMAQRPYQMIPHRDFNWKPSGAFKEAKKSWEARVENWKPIYADFKVRAENTRVKYVAPVVAAIKEGLMAFGMECMEWLWGLVKNHQIGSFLFVVGCIGLGMVEKAEKKLSMFVDTLDSDDDLAEWTRRLGYFTYLLVRKTSKELRRLLSGELGDLRQEAAASKVARDILFKQIDVLESKYDQFEKDLATIKSQKLDNEALIKELQDELNKLKEQK